MDDIAYMSRALQLARKGLYTTRQNPRVGCVIVKEDEIIGDGFHFSPGSPHAEINALNVAGDKARGSTVYVTLEPCSHYGKTPPCAEALITAGVSRVVIAMTDPNPKVSGAGLGKLRDAGIEIVQGVLAAEADRLNPGYIKRMEQGLPLVRLKMAMSLDGRTAMASGESQWITGTAARADVHRWRAQSCAVLTSSGTVLSDNPSLTFRPEDHKILQDEIPGATKQPLRVVCDTALKIPLDARVLCQPGQTIIATTQQTSSRAQEITDVGAELLTLPADKAGKVALSAVLHALAEREINEVLVEAGAGMAGALIAAQLVDELLIYMAPHLMGDSARGLMHLPELEKMSDRIDFEIDDIRAVGKDWRIQARPVYP